MIRQFRVSVQVATPDDEGVGLSYVQVRFHSMPVNLRDQELIVGSKIAQTFLGPAVKLTAFDREQHRLTYHPMAPEVRE